MWEKQHYGPMQKIQKKEEKKRKRLILVFTFAAVTQRVAVTFKPHQSSKHLHMNNKLLVARSRTVSDPGSTWSHTDHVLEEAEPANGTDLISAMEK